MNKRLLILLFSALLFSVACNAEGEGERGAVTRSQTELLSLMPERTNILVYANFQELKQTPFGEDLRAQFMDEIENENDEDYREFVEATGVDPERDIHELWLGVIEGDPDKDLGGVIVRGRFDESKIVDFAERKSDRGFTENSVFGHKVYVSRDRDDETGFTFLNSETIIVGNMDWLQIVLADADRDGRGVLDNPAMARYIEEVPHKKQLWGIINLDELSERWADEVRRRGSSFQGTESIENMKSISFYSDIDDRAKMYLTGNFGTAEEAELVAEMLNGFKAMAKLMVSDDREAIDMLNEIKVKTDGPLLRISTNLDREFFDKLQEKRQKFGEI